MKECIEFKEMISGYLDNELDSGLISEFEDHIASCISCREELDETKQTLYLLNSITEEELPQDFLDKLHTRLIEEKRDLDKKNYSTLLRNKYFRIISSVAAILVFAVLLKGLWGGNNFRTSSSQDAARQNIAYAPENAVADVQNSLAKGTQDSGAMRKSVNNDEFGSSQPTAEAKGKADISSSGTFSAADVKLGKTMAAPAKGIIKNTSLTLKVKDPANEIEKVKSSLLQYGAKIMEKLNLQTTAQYSIKASETPEMKVFNLEFIISSSEFNKALDYLKASWGEDAITTKDMEVIKVSDEIIQLNTELKELDTQIQNFDKDNKSNISLEEIVAKKNKIQIEIDDLRKDAEYTIVSLVVEIK